MKIKSKIGEIWVWEKYIHGPRLKNPKLFSKFRLGGNQRKMLDWCLGKIRRQESGRYKVR